MRALDYFVKEPVKYRRPGLAWYRLWQLVHDRTNGALAEPYLRLSRLWRPPVGLPPAATLAGKERDGVTALLKRDGFALLPDGLSSADIAALKQFAFSTPAYGIDPAKPVHIRETDVPHAEGRYTWRTQDVIGHPVVRRLVTEGPYCAIAQDYLGCRPTLVAVTLWVNPPFKGYGANEYHYDNDGPAFLKYFILLTDMDIGTGAHYFIKGSHTRRKPAQIARSRLYEADELFRHYDRIQEHVAGGCAGTIFAEDTLGFHRGSDITSDYRLLLQLEFAVIDTPQVEELKNPIVPEEVPGLDPGIASMTRKFYVPGPALS